MLRLRFGEAAPGQFRIGKHDRRHDKPASARGFTHNYFDRVAPLACCLVRQQHAARAIANGVNRGVVGLLLLVDLDKPLFVTLDPCILKPEIVAIRHASHRDQYTVIQLLFRLPVRLDYDADLLPLGFHPGDLRADTNFPEGSLGARHRMRSGSPPVRIESSASTTTTLLPNAA